MSKIIGAEWSVNKAHARSRVRLCFANLSREEINQGVATLAEICREKFGVP
jgi:2-aminoadipate transaminase